MKISLDKLAGLSGTADNPGPLTRLIRARGIRMSAMFRFLDVSTAIQTALEKAAKIRTEAFDKYAVEDEESGEKKIPKDKIQSFIDELKELYKEEVELPDIKLYQSDIENSPDIVIEDITLLKDFILRGPTPKGK